MEMDDEVDGEGNSLDFGARVYDARLGRWLSVDPLAHKYTAWSGYNFVMDNPIIFIDPDGKEVDFSNTFTTIGEQNKNENEENQRNPEEYINNNFLKELSDKTGLGLALNDDNLLIVTDEDIGDIKSETLRELVLDAINNPNTLNVELNPKSFLSQGKDNKISIGGVEIDRNMGGTSLDLNQTTYGWVLTFVHEYDHTNFGSSSVHSDTELDHFGPENMGSAVKLANTVRSELSAYGKDGNYGQRLSYKRINYYTPFTQKAVDQLKADPNATLEGGFVNKKKYFTR